jgi:UDP-N-acetylglucosamine 2-epimerase (non-hydrolysing)
MKAAPLCAEFKNYEGVYFRLVHTGQHYDRNLSRVFFKELKLPKPHYYLGVGSDSHSAQTARIMSAFEEILSTQKPDCVIVVGDVNSTLACALTTAKYRCSVRRYRPLIAHVEAGLRSHDPLMPEEINRKLTDAISDMLFITEPVAQDNLLREGVDGNRIFYVGNVMIDTLLAFKKRAEGSTIKNRLQVKTGEYALLTLHRPGNVDNIQDLKKLFRILERIAIQIPVIFPVHPRTQAMLTSNEVNADFLKIIPPLGYLDFLNLMMDARFVLTDSGGIQEETTVLGVPCITLRETTERPITVTLGTNTVVGRSERKIVEAVEHVLQGDLVQGRIPRFWDGKAAKRICKIIYHHLKHQM